MPCTPLELTLALLFALCVGVRLWFLFWGLLPLARHKNSPPPEKLPSLTILVCAHNEADNLPTLLPLLVTQDYPDLRILIVDDRSSDGTAALLADWSGNYPAVNVLRVDETPKGWSPKKYALQQGMAQVKTEWTLFTDADCRPASPQWARLMAADMDEKTTAILGDAPLKTGGGLLGWLQRQENQMTMLHGLGFAKMGHPYLAIGRNWAVRTEVFHKVGGTTSHQAVLSGDDDLTLQKIARLGPVKFNNSPSSQVLSNAPSTLLLWNRQKKRHIGAGTAYSPAALFRLATLYTANFLPPFLVLVGMSVSSLWPLSACILTGLWIAEVLVIRELSLKRGTGFALGYLPFSLFHPLLVGYWALTNRRKTQSNWS